MKSKLQDLPLVNESFGDMVRGVDWGEFKSASMHFPAGTDFCLLLKGLPDDHCQCPHWGYVIQGKVRVTYTDGHQEVVEAGELYHWPSGHTVLFEEDTYYVEFSPKDEMNMVLNHVVNQMKR